MASKNSLHLAQQIQLGKHVSKNMLACEETRRANSLREYALIASRDLGFTITESNVKSVAKALDIRVPWGRMHAAPAARSRDQAITTMAQAIVHLQGRCGITPSEDLLRLAGLPEA